MNVTASWILPIPPRPCRTTATRSEPSPWNAVSLWVSWFCPQNALSQGFLPTWTESRTHLEDLIEVISSSIEFYSLIENFRLFLTLFEPELLVSMKLNDVWWLSYRKSQMFRNLSVSRIFTWGKFDHVNVVRRYSDGLCVRFSRHNCRSFWKNLIVVSKISREDRENRPLLSGPRLWVSCSFNKQSGQKIATNFVDIDQAVAGDILSLVPGSW